MRIWDDAYSSYCLEMCTPEQDEDSNTNKSMKRGTQHTMKKEPREREAGVSNGVEGLIAVLPLACFDDFA